MESSAAVGKTVSVFVKWEEVFSTNNRGIKVVRYYLKRRDGTSDLAVVGKEKNLGNNTKMAPSSSYRYRCAIRDKSLFASSNLPLEISSKLRSRREVIDWLSSLVTEFLWVGSAWTCGKRRKHYEGYTRSGVRISVHDFVYVLAEEDKRLVAYVDDLYEDSRGNKTAVVRWFHKVDEVGLDLLPRYNDKEIFFSLCLQDLSIECIDGLATVLSPQHYEKFLKADPSRTKLDPFICRNQFDNEVVKPFDITQVKGYWNQNIHRCMSLTPKAVGIGPRKRLRRLVDTRECSDLWGRPLNDEFDSKKRNLAENVMQKHEYTIGSKIEILSQDSGIRGIWFKAVVIKKHKDKLKVRYEDIKDAADESIDLEEWILSSRVAAPDQFGIRHSGRMTVRPSRPSNINSDTLLVDVGCVVDAWLHDGWWEGIVVRNESDDRIHVYFLGEKRRSIVGCKHLRYSEEWLGDGWKRIKRRPDLLGLISSSVSQTTKSHDNISSLSSGHIDLQVVDQLSKEYIVAHLKWSWSTKKRQGRNSSQRLKTRNYDGFLMPCPDKCKSICHSVASPLTSLVMSR